MSITVVAGVLMYGLVFLRTRSDASIFTSSLVLTYCLYLQWSAMSASPALDGVEFCNPYYGPASPPWNRTFMTIIGLFFTFISLMVISAATFKDEKQVHNMDTDQAAVNVATGMNAPLMEKEDASDVAAAQENIEREAKGEKPIYRPLPITTATIFFQALLILAAVYYAMLLTDWSTKSIFTTGVSVPTSFSFWI